MELINHNGSQINVEALMSRLLRRGTMTERFKLPMTKEQAYQLLLAAVKGEVEYRARKFEFNDAVKSYANTIAEWLTGDSSKFGLLLCGNVGNGKSTFVKAFQQLLNQLNLRSEDNRDYRKIRIIDARTVAYLCKSDYREWEELGRLPMLAIDDLGTEPLEIQDYGNIMSPMVDLLTRRYDKQLFTIVTTNLMPKEIRPKYGVRIGDRFNEMMVKIQFENDTYRTFENPV